MPATPFLAVCFPNMKHSYVDDNALSVNINRIREKLASIDLTDFIKTKHRQGYTI